MNLTRINVCLINVSYCLVNFRNNYSFNKGSKLELLLELEYDVVFC